MNTSLVCLVLALSSSWTAPSAGVPENVGPTAAIFARAEPYGLFDEVLDRMPDESDSNRFYFNFRRASLITVQQKLVLNPSLLRAQRDAVIRAQSPNIQLADGSSSDVGSGSSGYPETFVAPNGTMPVSPLSPTSPGTPYEEPRQQYVLPPNSSPYMTAPPGAIPGATTWGANGPQPYRLGYSLWADMAWLPGRPTSIDGKNFEVFETNIGLNHTIPTWWSPWLFSLEHQFGYRSWQGPRAVDLPGDVYRFGWDMRLETPLNSEYRPFAFSLAFNPSINSDFGQELGRNAFNFDGRGILYYQADPRWLLALGAGFWDRVNDRVVPYVGVVWQPDDRWEFRIMWPQSRIQWYMGNIMGEDVWLYASGEYHVESYQISTSSAPAGKDQIELEDYRILLGVRKSNRWASGFIEGGWVFGRHDVMRTGPDFSVSSGFIGRIGLRF